jgi:hypothetical protein
MSVIEAEINDIPLTIPSFTVDGVLHNQIPKVLPHKSHSMMFSGRAGSGKSSIVSAFLTQSNPPLYKGVFDFVYVFIPKNSFDSQSNSPFKNHKRLYHELTQETISMVEKEIEHNARNKKNSLVLMDDMASYLKDVELQKTLVRFLCNRRHTRLSFWVCVQSYIQLPLIVRKNITHFIIFRPSNKKEIQSITDEVNIDSKEFDAYMSYVFKPDGTTQDRAFIYIDENGNVHNKFNRLKIKS